MNQKSDKIRDKLFLQLSQFQVMSLSLDIVVFRFELMFLFSSVMAG